MRRDTTTTHKVRAFIAAGGTGTAGSVAVAIGCDRHGVAGALRNMAKNREIDVIGEVVHDPKRPRRRAPVYGARGEHHEGFGISLVAAAMASRHPIETVWAQRGAQ